MMKHAYIGRMQTEKVRSRGPDLEGRRRTGVGATECGMERNRVNRD